MTTSVILPMALRKQIEELAKQQHRSISGQLVFLIAQALQQQPQQTA
jgi:hypothetical protein